MREKCGLDLRDWSDPKQQPGKSLGLAHPSGAVGGKRGDNTLQIHWGPGDFGVEGHPPQNSSNSHSNPVTSYQKPRVCLLLTQPDSRS